MRCELCLSEHIFVEKVITGEWCYEGWANQDFETYLCLECGNWTLSQKEPWPLQEDRSNIDFFTKADPGFED